MLTRGLLILSRASEAACSSNSPRSCLEIVFSKIVRHSTVAVSGLRIRTSLLSTRSSLKIVQFRTLMREEEGCICSTARPSWSMSQHHKIWFPALEETLLVMAEDCTLSRAAQWSFDSSPVFYFIGFFIGFFSTAFENTILGSFGYGGGYYLGSCTNISVQSSSGLSLSSLFSHLDIDSHIQHHFGRRDRWRIFIVRLHQRQHAVVLRSLALTLFLSPRY